MAAYKIRHGLLLEDRISLLNRLSSYYSMSDFFFNLKRDTVRAANDRTILPVPEMKIDNKYAAEKIRQLCERLRLLDVTGEDSLAVARKKNLLRRKLLKLTRNLSDNR